MFIHMFILFSLSVSCSSLTATLHERVFISVFIISMLITFTQNISPSSTLSPALRFFHVLSSSCFHSALHVPLHQAGMWWWHWLCFYLSPSVLTDADATGACPPKGAWTESALWKDQSWETSEGVGGLEGNGSSPGPGITESRFPVVLHTLGC